MQPDLFWAIILGECLIALASIAVPNDAGVLKDHDDDPAARHSRPRLARSRRGDIYILDSRYLWFALPYAYLWVREQILAMVDFRDASGRLA